MVHSRSHTTLARAPQQGCCLSADCLMLQAARSGVASAKAPQVEQKRSGAIKTHMTWRAAATHSQHPSKWQLRHLPARMQEALFEGLNDAPHFILQQAYSTNYMLLYRIPAVDAEPPPSPEQVPGGEVRRDAVPCTQQPQQQLQRGVAQHGAGGGWCLGAALQHACVQGGWRWGLSGGWESDGCPAGGAGGGWCLGAALQHACVQGGGRGEADGCAVGGGKRCAHCEVFRKEAQAVVLRHGAAAER